MDRPLLLVDIDGVLNCFGNLGTSTVNFEQEFVADGRYTIKVPEGTAAAIVRLNEVFECVWCTTWEDKAHLVGDPIGIPAWPHIPLDFTVPDKTIKLPSVIGYVGDRPFAWIDDDLHEDAHAWAAERAVPTLLVQPTPNYGMTAEHVEQLLDWAANL